MCVCVCVHCTNCGGAFRNLLKQERSRSRTHPPTTFTEAEAEAEADMMMEALSPEDYEKLVFFETTRTNAAETYLHSPHDCDVSPFLI